MNKEPERKQAPFILEWRITDRCNLGCIHCERDRSMPEISPTRAARILDAFQSFCLERERRGTVRIAGGEPLLSPHLLRCVEGAMRRGLRPELRTNATLVSARIARRLHAAGLRSALVRIHGVGPSHDVLARPGSFDLAMEGVSLLREAGIQVLLALALTRINLDEAGDAVRIAKAEADGLVIERFVPNARAALLWKERCPPPALKDALLRLAREAEQSALPLFVNDPLGAVLPARTPWIHFRACPAGRDLLAVDPRGEVYPCEKLRLSAGNLLRRSLHEIHRAPLLRTLRISGGKRVPCGSCSLDRSCRGCRADAFAGTGNPFARDPLCLARTRFSSGDSGSVPEPASAVPR